MMSHAHLPFTLPCLGPRLPPAPNLWLLLLLFQIGAWFYYAYERRKDDDRGNWLVNFCFDYVYYSWKEYKNEGLPEPIGRIAKTSWPRRTRFTQFFCWFLIPQADHPLLVGAVVDWNLSSDLLLFIEEIHMNNTVTIICSKMQNLKQIFQ